MEFFMASKAPGYQVLGPDIEPMYSVGWRFLILT